MTGELAEAVVLYHRCRLPAAGIHQEQLGGSAHRGLPSSHRGRCQDPPEELTSRASPLGSARRSSPWDFGCWDLARTTSFLAHAWRSWSLLTGIGE
jgi:hypothetical protein